MVLMVMSWAEAIMSISDALPSITPPAWWMVCHKPEQAFHSWLVISSQCPGGRVGLGLGGSFLIGLDFSGEAWSLCVTFPRSSRKPSKSKTERERGYIGAPGQPRGEELPCRFLSRPVTLSQSGHVPTAPDKKDFFCD